MGQFKYTKIPIEGLCIIEPRVFEDNRGFFMETYNYEDFGKAGFGMTFVQDNQSKSKRGVLRGLHYQKKYPQEKLVRVIKGEIFDVAVDIRKDSKTFGQWYGIILNSENRKQFYIPTGFAHGFFVLSDEAEIVYKCTNFYHPEDEYGIAWDDKNINIKWPLARVDEVILSEKDKNWPYLKNVIMSPK